MKNIRLIKLVKNKKIIISLFLILSIMLSLGFIPYPVRALTNVSIGKTAVFQMNDGTAIAAAWGNIASRAIDGNNGTVAQSVFAGDYNLLINLSGVYSISSVNIAWDSVNYASSYNVMCTLNGTDWTILATETGKTGGAVESVFTAIQCRQVMIKSNAVVGPYGYGIWEMAIMGDMISEDTNVAYHKTATMIKDDGSPQIDAWGNIAAKAVDGLSETIAQAADANVPYNLKVDCGSMSQINTVIIDNYWSGYILKFNIKTSDDGVIWTTILTNKVPTVNSKSIFSLGQIAECRYILLDVTEFSPNGYGGAIGDFAAMGTSSLTLSNIAFNKPSNMAKDDGCYEPYAWGQHPKNAFDGSSDTIAQGSGIDEPWNLIVNLKAQSTQITKFAISNYWAGEIKSCNIKASNDGTNWVTILAGLTPPADTRSTYDLVTAINYKWIMLDVVSFSTGTQGCIADFEVLGTIVDDLSYSPIISGIRDGDISEKATITFTEGVATLNGNPFISGTEISKTGEYQLIVTNSEGMITTANFKIIKNGDVTGDGNIDIVDVGTIKSHLLKINVLAGAYKIAGNFSNKSNISIVDLLTIKKFVMNIGRIPENLRLCNIWPHDDATNFVSPIFSNNMILQRNQPVVVWGNTMGQNLVEVALESNGVKEYVIATIRENTWRAVFPSRDAGSGTYKLTISSDYEVKEFNNILFGEVWVASGQSNMAMEANGANGPTDAINYLNQRIPQSIIRFCSNNSLDMQTWNNITTTNQYNYSCIGLTYACKLYESQNVPIGIIQAAIGNTYAQAWMSSDALNRDLELAAYLDKFHYNYTYVTPTKNYEHLIARILPISIKGIIWYQGENNANINETATKYSKIMTSLITDWRAKWRQGDIVFLIVQLPKFEIGWADWTGVRHSQVQLQKSLKNVGTTISIDKGNINPNPSLLIHPTDKLEIANRLALLAKKMVYNENIIANSPLYKDYTIVGNKIRIKFDVYESFLYTPFNMLTEFEICGSNKVYQNANASIISNDTIEVWSDSITNPTGARYCWKNNPKQPSVFNSLGLPASPFDTEDKF